MPDVEDYSKLASSNTDDFPEGQAPSTLNDGCREIQADIARWKDRIDGTLSAGGTVNAITALQTYSSTSHVNGRTVVVRAAGANTSTTPSFQLDSLAAKTIVKSGNNALSAGDIKGAGHYLILKYNSTNDNWELLNPASPGLGTLDQYNVMVGGGTGTDVTMVAPSTAGQPLVSNGASADPSFQGLPQSGLLDAETGTYIVASDDAAISAFSNTSYVLACSFYAPYGGTFNCYAEAYNPQGWTSTVAAYVDGVIQTGVISSGNLSQWTAGNADVTVTAGQIISFYYRVTGGSSGYARRFRIREAAPKVWVQTA
jgi:hypothetical protein